MRHASRAEARVGQVPPRGTRASLLRVHPPLKRWAKLYRPASGTGARRYGLFLQVNDGQSLVVGQSDFPGFT
jgi:hypothetical protein